MAKQVKQTSRAEAIGRNVLAEIQGETLVLRIDLAADGHESKSGKSSVIGTTNGNVGIAGTDVKIGLNVYRPI